MFLTTPFIGLRLTPLYAKDGSGRAILRNRRSIDSIDDNA